MNFIFGDADFLCGKQIRVIGLQIYCSDSGLHRFINDENRMPPVNSFDDYLLWADSTETISRIDRIASLFVLILHRKIENHPYY